MVGHWIGNASGRLAGVEAVGSEAVDRPSWSYPRSSVVPPAVSR